MFAEFRKFILRGNVMDLAVGIIIGSAFTAIVNSLVNDIIMPPIGFAIGGVDFSQLVITLKEAVGETPAVTINIGLFINALVQFLIVAFVVFLLIRSVNKMMTRFEKAPAPATPAAPAAPSTEEQLLAAIKDLTAAIKKN